MVFVGIAGILVAIWTLRKIERQTKATEGSVQALIASERAWLTASFIRQATKFADGQWYKTEPHTIALNDEEMSQGFYYGYKMRVTNIGKTPALITGFEYRVSLLGKGETKLHPNSGNVIDTKYEERTLPGGQSVDLFYAKIDGFMTLHRQKIDALECTAVFHGDVKYRPIIDPSEDSCADFCYVYSPKQQILIRRDEYNPNRRKKQPASRM